MGVSELTVRMPRDNGIPADDVVNVWHFGHAAAELDAGQITTLVGAVEDFYDTDVPSATGAVASFFANYMNLVNSEIKIYNAADPSPRLPYHTQAIDLDVARQGANDLPGEVAVCFSYRGVPVTGENPGRRRGRLFLGCLNTDVMGSPVNSIVGVHADFRKSIEEAAERLVAAIDPIEFGIYSRGIGTLSGPNPSTTPTATEDWTPFFTQAVLGHVDDAFDTQRRRGAASQVRTGINLTV